MAKKTDTRKMILLTLFSALIIVMSMTVGYIPLGFMNATIIHIPVIIGAILLGPAEGGFLGFVFGLTSLINNTVKPNITSFVFTPFYSMSPEFSGSFKSLIVCFVPRILIGVISAYLFILLSKTKLPKAVSLSVTGFIGSMVNTVFVMGGIYLLFGESYAAASGKSYEALLGIIMGIVGINGVPEAIVAAILTAAVVIPLNKVMKKGR